MEDEYVALSAGCAFDHAELKQIARNGFEVALVDEDQRQRWLQELEGTEE